MQLIEHSLCVDRCRVRDRYHFTADRIVGPTPACPKPRGSTIAPGIKGCTDTFRRRSGRHPRNTIAACLPWLHPAEGSTRGRENPAGRKRVLPDFFGGNRQGTRALPAEAHVFEELADLRRLAFEACQFRDPLGGLGDGSGQTFFERFADDVPKRLQFTDWAIGFPFADTVEPILPKRPDDALNRATQDVRIPGGLLALGTLMKHPYDVHSFANTAGWVRMPFFQDDGDLGLSEMELEPGTHGVPPCDAGDDQDEESKQTDSNHNENVTKSECVIDCCGEYNIF